MGYETLGITKAVTGDTNSYSIEYTYNHLEVEAIPVAVTSKIGRSLMGLGTNGMVLVAEKWLQ